MFNKHFMGAPHPSRPPCRLRQKSTACLQREESSGGAVFAESRQACQSGTYELAANRFKFFEWNGGFPMETLCGSYATKR